MGEIKVKPLEWREFERGYGSAYANTMFGRYTAWDFDGKDSHYKTPEGSAGVMVGGDVEAAKAAAQADFERRILSALTPEA